MGWFDDLADRLLRMAGIDESKSYDLARPAPEPVRPTPRSDGSTYWVYTTEFDVEAPIGLLDSLIGGPSDSERSAMRERWAAVPVDTDGIRNWAESRIDLPAISDTSVVLLLDHSGSLRNGPMEVEAAIAKGFVRAMSALGVQFEVLGHTTQSWKGGRSALKWDEAGRPRMPGRLCDLLHLVYGDETSLAKDDSALSAMFHPRLLRENVDGEALQWALKRLRERPRQQRAVIVVSDGASLDDSTHHRNGPGMLHFHLLDMIGSVGEVGLVAINLGPADSPYPEAFEAGSVAEGQTALLKALDQIFPQQAN